MSILWATDVDLTIIDRNASCKLPPVNIEAMADWLACEDRVLALISSGSLQSLERDGIDIFSLLARELTKRLGPSSVQHRLQSNLVIHFSQGAESYRIADAAACQLKDQVCLEKVISIANPCQAIRYLEDEGLSVLASDVAVGDPNNGTVAIFLRRRDAPVVDGRSEARQLTLELDKRGFGIRVSFVRRDLESKHRFDAHAAAAPGKIGVAKELFRKFDHVLYTGDNLNGSDEEVFALANDHIYTVKVESITQAAAVVSGLLTRNEAWG